MLDRSADSGSWTSSDNLGCVQDHYSLGSCCNEWLSRAALSVVDYRSLDRRVVVCARACVCIEPPETRFQGPRCLADGKLGCLAYRAPVRSSFDRQQSAVSAKDAYPPLIRFLPAWISPGRSAHNGNHGGILRRSSVSRFSDERIRCRRVRQGHTSPHSWRCFWAIARGVLESGLSSLARHHVADCIYRDDVGHCIPRGRPQPGARNCRALPERRDGASMGELLHADWPVGCRRLKTLDDAQTEA